MKNLLITPASDFVDSKTCTICKQELINTDEKTHINEFHPSGSHICCVCIKKYENIKQLKSHLRTHK